jgi:hypothetical protein
MRKWIILFLSVLVMAGSLIPCCPADNCGDELAASALTHPEEESDSGNCSPFFTCGTCVGFVHQIPLLSIQTCLLQVQEHKSRLTEHISANFIHGFFQPPRKCFSI